MKLNIHRRSSGFTVIDVLAVSFVVTFTVACATGCWRESHGGSNRVKCASNLRQIGQALLLYANENGGNYPRTTFAEGDVVKPTWGTGVDASKPFGLDGPAANDVTSAVFLLARTQDITSEVFACPSSDAVKDDFGGDERTANDRSNFSDWRTNLSYSYANPYPNATAKKAGYVLNSSLGAEFAVASDRNPGMLGGDDGNVTTVNVNSPMSSMKFANTFNHDGDGQNILYGDGHVEFANTPFVGLEKDNIYTSKLDNAIVESPEGPTDSILLPPEK